MNTKTLLLWFISLTFSDASAQTIWYVFPGGLGVRSGYDWPNASGSLQAAIDSADSGDEIWVATGTYHPTVPYDGGWDNHKTFYIQKNIKLYGGFQGGETDKSARDWVLNPTTLSGDLNEDDVPGLMGDDLWSHVSRKDNAYHVFWLDQVSDSMVISGFIIASGNASFPGNSENGAGIYIAASGSTHKSNPVVEYCAFRQNSAYGRGGAIFNDGSQGGMANMRVVQCSFTGNYAKYQGGAVFNSGEYNGTANPYFLNCGFKDNKSGFDGGAIFNNGVGEGISSPTFDHCVFEFNHAITTGGAMTNFGHSGTSSPQFAHCNFNNNTSMRGGAVDNAGIENGVSSPNFSACTFEQNAATSYGGAVYNNGNDGTSKAEFTNCIFLNNSSEFQGGAVYNNGDDGISSPILKSCVFEGNFAESGGGALYNYGSHGTSSPQIDSCSFTGNNTEGGGGAICNASFTAAEVSPLISHCSFSANEASDGGAISDFAPYGLAKSVFSNCFFTKNNALADGGAIASVGGSTEKYNPYFLNCTFSENTANRYGGALHYLWRDESSPNLINCAFWGNTAAEGGGTYGFSNPDAHPSFINCSFSNNQAATDGGAMNIRTCDGCATPYFIIFNSIYWYNHAADGKSIFIHWATPRLYNTLLEETSCPTGDTSIAYCEPSTVLFNQNPLFVDQNSNNLHLQTSSPAINSGNNSILPDSVVFDLDGNSRIAGGTVDMGVYELKSVSVKEIVVNDGGTQLDIIPNPFEDQTKINFQLTEAMPVRLRIVDVTGRLRMDIEHDYAAGYHSEIFQVDPNLPQGILFFEFFTPFGRSSKKLVHLHRD